VCAGLGGVVAGGGWGGGWEWEICTTGHISGTLLPGPGGEDEGREAEVLAQRGGGAGRGRTVPGRM